MSEQRPLGIAPMFSKVTFKQDGVAVFAADVTSGGCFGPDKALDVANRGYDELKSAISAGKLGWAATNFNSVAIGAREYKIERKTAARIESIKPV